MQLVEDPEMLVFCSYYELLVIHKSGMLRYSHDLAHDCLEVLALNGDILHLNGRQEFSQDDEQWTMPVTDIPIVQVELK
jgi:hypothetical protein